MASRFKFARAGAGITGVAAVLLMAAAIPASADPAVGRVEDGAKGLSVNVGDGFKSDLATELIALSLDDGSKIGVYCVEIDTPLDRNEPLVEKNWEDYPDQASPFNENQDQINWVLHNGFPEKKTGELAKVLTDRGTALNDGSLSVAEAVAGTQAAIWRFSDEVELDPADPVPGDARGGQDVLALFEFLTGPDNVGLSNEPNAALSIDPKTRDGKAGERIGPFTVSTSGTIEKIATSLPYGVRITDLDGRALNAKQIKNGTELFFDVPADSADGAGSIEITGLANVDTGRLFVAQDYLNGQESQSVIVADAAQSRLTADASAEWTEEDAQTPPAQQGKNEFDDDDLAETGASILVPLIIGGVLIVGGAGTLLLLRRKKI